MGDEGGDGIRRRKIMREKNAYAAMEEDTQTGDVHTPLLVRR